MAMHGSSGWVLGIGASAHNGAACLLRDGKVWVAIQEERVTRTKRAALVPGRGSHAIAYCLKAANIQVSDLSMVVVCALDSSTADSKVADIDALEVLFEDVPVAVIPHHMGHAIGAFATSGADRAVVLVADGSGTCYAELPAEEQQRCVGLADGDEVVSIYSATASGFTLLEKHMGFLVDAPRSRIGVSDLRFAAWRRFGSLGGMYGAASAQVFANMMDGPGKLMGLAPYGTANIDPDAFVSVRDDLLVYGDPLEQFRGMPPWPEHQREYRDLAASTQRALERALAWLWQRAKHLSHQSVLCYAGGVALNGVANECLLRSRLFDTVHFMPAAEDSGTALGAAYYGHWQLTGSFSSERLRHDSVGRSYAPEEIQRAAEHMSGLSYQRPVNLVEATVDLLCDGKIVGWFQGGSELGPRALGQRSILADPRSPDMKQRLNHRVKFREAFRPFAPVIPLSEVEAWFELAGTRPSSEHMLRVVPFHEHVRDRVPAVVHVDGTGRLQTLEPDANGPLYDLARAFGKRTGVPILLNTSLNIAGEPIVETPEEALWCLLYTGIDACVLGDMIATKPAGYDSILDLHFESRAELAPAAVGTPVIPAARVDTSDPWLLCGTSLDDRGEEVWWSRPALPSDVIRHRVSTPLGPMVYYLGPKLSQTLAGLITRRRGRALAQALKVQIGADDATVIKALGSLKRSHLVTVTFNG